MLLVAAQCPECGEKAVFPKLDDAPVNRDGHMYWLTRAICEYCGWKSKKAIGEEE